MQAKSRPNIILAMADDLGYGELGCYGQERAKTPRLDAMAAEGLRFTQAYSGNTLCAPARCTLMTGLHTGHSLIRANIEIPLRPKDKTVGEVLKPAGYTTAVIGKWGLGRPGSSGVPTKKGFDSFYGVLTHMEAHNYFPAFVYRNEDHEETGNVLERENVAKVKAKYFPDLMTEETLRFLDNQKDQPNPFFLYLPYTLPHVNNEQDADHMNEIPSLGIYEDMPWTHANKGHAAMITYLDTAMGQILDRLKANGMDENTLVFFTADNGPLIVGGVDPIFFKSSGALKGYKRDLYEGGQRVPLIARWPGHVPAGVTTDRPVAFWDFMPTLADLAGVTDEPASDGVSFVPDLFGQPNPNPPKPMYWEVHEGGYRKAARIGHWKAILTVSTGELELYDLTRDQREQNDVSATETEVAQLMRDYFKEAWTPPEPGATPASSNAS